jgi:diaminopimelate decarboxylase
MVGFYRRQTALTCDGVDLEAIARATGTPVYVYSAAVIRQQVTAFREAFAGRTARLHYALKANSNLAVTRLIRALGCGADANSAGEIDVALAAGFSPDQIVFTGVGKTPTEIDRAVALGLRSINVESPGELERIDRAARARGGRARVAIRVNPAIGAGGHPYISTGQRTSQFGVPLDQAAAVCRDAAGRAGVALGGLHVHIGSQIVDLEPLRRAIRAVADLAAALRREGVAIEELDVGGGLGISYDGRPVPTIADYAAVVQEATAGLDLALVLEPGRAIVGPAGALLTAAVDVKHQTPGRAVVVLDAGLTELVRPALYGAFHRIEPLAPRTSPPTACDFVGPLCEASDVVAADRWLSEPAVGDRFAILDTGAYGFVMASNYNRRPMPPEVLVLENDVRVVRRRQTIADLLALECADAERWP